MNQRKKNTFMTSATAASAGGTFKTDYRSDDGSTQRTLYGILTSGAQVNLYFNVYDANGTQVLRHLEATISAGSSTYTTATFSFAEVINGPVEEIEIRKADGTGTATVIGIL